MGEGGLLGYQNKAKHNHNVKFSCLFVLLAQVRSMARNGPMQLSDLLMMHLLLCEFVLYQSDKLKGIWSRGGLNRERIS